MKLKFLSDTIFLLWFAVIFCMETYAYTGVADTVLNMGEVVVTGSRTERPLSQSPGSIQVVTPL